MRKQLFCEFGRGVALLLRLRLDLTLEVLLRNLQSPHFLFESVIRIDMLNETGMEQ